MPMFRRGDVEIAFLDEGAGDPILLVHGFASNAAVNWVYPGWVATLNGAGLRVIALDNRGHGSSTKCYNPIAYHSATMAEDAHALLDHLDVPRADFAQAVDDRLAHGGDRQPGACAQVLFF